MPTNGSWRPHSYPSWFQWVVWSRRQKGSRGSEVCPCSRVQTKIWETENRLDGLGVMLTVAELLLDILLTMEGYLLPSYSLTNPEVLHGQGWLTAIRWGENLSLAIQGCSPGLPHLANTTIGHPTALQFCINKQICFPFVGLGWCFGFLFVWYKCLMQHLGRACTTQMFKFKFDVAFCILSGNSTAVNFHV